MLLAIALSIGTALPVPQQPDARLEGILLDAHSRPVPGAAVEASVDGAVVRRAASDGSGVFVLTKLPHAEIAVRATTTAPDVGGAFADLRHADRGFVQVAMMPARVVRGTVVDDRGQPLTGAFVALAVPGPAEFGAIAQAVTSDEHGAFVFPHAPVGELGVRGWRQGLVGVAVAIDGAADAVVQCTLAAGDPQCRTFVLHDADAEQAAAAVLQVRAFADRALVPMPAAVARPGRDDKGAFVVRGWPCADEMRAHVAIAGAFAEPMDAKIPPDSGDRTKEFWVADPATTSCRGRLVSADGLAVAGRRLVAVAPSRFDGLGLQATATTAADGGFEFVSPVADGTPLLLTCLDDGCGLAAGDGTSWQPEARAALAVTHRPRRVHELRLVQATTIAARLIDGGGAPVAGADVVVLGAAHDGARLLGAAWASGPQRDVLARGHSDGLGHIAIRNLPLPDRDLVLVVESPAGCITAAFEPSTPRTDLGELRLNPGITVRGTACRPDGSPWPAARITVASGNHAAEAARLLVADRTGAFTVRGLAPGPTWVGIAGTRTGALHRLGDAPEVVVEIR